MRKELKMEQPTVLVEDPCNIVAAIKKAPHALTITKPRIQPDESFKFLVKFHDMPFALQLGNYSDQDNDLTWWTTTGISDKTDKGAFGTFAAKPPLEEGRKDTDAIHAICVAVTHRWADFLVSQRPSEFGDPDKVEEFRNATVRHKMQPAIKDSPQYGDSLWCVSSKRGEEEQRMFNCLRHELKGNRSRFRPCVRMGVVNVTPDSRIFFNFTLHDMHNIREVEDDEPFMPKLTIPSSFYSQGPVVQSQMSASSNFAVPPKKRKTMTLADFDESWMIQKDQEELSAAVQSSGKRKRKNNRKAATMQRHMEEDEDEESEE